MELFSFFRILLACLNRNVDNKGKMKPFMSSFVTRSRIQKLAEEQNQLLIEKFKKIENFSATSDIWSRSNRSYIAVTVHYIDSLDENVKSAYIACELFEGQHTNDLVAAKLSTIFNRFGILDKVSYVTTDGAGEYVAAFKYYGENYRSISALNLFSDDFEWFGDPDISTAHTSTDSNVAQGSSESTAQFVDDSSEDEYSFVRIDIDDDSVNNGKSKASDAGDSHELTSFYVLLIPCSGNCADEDSDTDSRMYELPQLSGYHRVLSNINRIACSSHALDKVGSKDSKNAEKDVAYKSAFERVFSKLNDLWALRKTRLKAENFTRITGRKLIGPHRIRWMKTYDAVGNILSINLVQLNQALTEMGVHPIEEYDHSFLKDWH